MYVSSFSTWDDILNAGQLPSGGVKIGSQAILPLLLFLDEAFPLLLGHFAKPAILIRIFVAQVPILMLPRIEFDQH